MSKTYLPYLAEYAISGKSSCKGCEKLISKDSMRLAVMIQSAHFDGKTPNWYHFDCFFNTRRPKTTDDIENYECLRVSDQDKIKSHVGTGDVTIVLNKKERWLEDLDAQLKKYDLKDFTDACGNSGWRCGQKIHKDEVRVSDNDFETEAGREYGGQYNTYFDQVRADLSHFKFSDKLPGFESLEEENQDIVKNAIRQEVISVNGMKLKNEVDGDKTEYEYKAQNRQFFKHHDALKNLDLSEWHELMTHNDQEIPAGKNKILDHLADIMTFGALVPCSSCEGGQFYFTNGGYVCSGDFTEWSKCQKMTKEPEREAFKVPPRLKKHSFLNKYKYAARTRIIKTKAVDRKEIAEKLTSTSISYESDPDSVYTKAVPRKIRLMLKGGMVVDPDSKLEQMTHVYQDGADEYSVVLGLTDIQSGKNSYYKLQLLESDSKLSGYWLFRSWGRIGTTIGGSKTELVKCLYEAKSKFTSLYKKKTGNMWNLRHNFKKIPGGMYPIDVHYAEEKRENSNIIASESLLPTPVQDVIKLVFEDSPMEDLMLEFELDTEKMPVGKLSKKQIQKGIDVLEELLELMKDESDLRSRFVDASNRFYTLIPHSFGIGNPPILNDLEVVEKNLEMLKSLTKLELSYNLMVDMHYEQLKTELVVLEHESEEFAIISEYLKNTHVCKCYDIVIDEIYTVKRHVEDERFEPFRKFPNHKLLWHGSRVTYYPGILSQGLRIAPPETPINGHKFGKGIYFADMVSNSARYCDTCCSYPEGLMLLCDVALGNSYEILEDESITKLPEGTHSCKGLGEVHPDPSNVKKIEGIEVPLGVEVPNPAGVGSPYRFNDYVVYDEAQVEMKYLVKVDFKFQV